MDTSSSYIMDDPREADRLRAKVNAEAWADKYGKQFGTEVLEVGCGPGVLLEALANQVTSRKVTGIELSSDRADQANARLQSLGGICVKGNALELPFEQDQFDTVYTRFLLEYLAERELAVREMVRVCRPGGRVVLQDLDGQLKTLWPLTESMEAAIHQVLAALESSGFDPDVGRKLYGIAWSAGLTDIQVAVEPYHLIAGTMSPEQQDLWGLKLEIARPQIEKALGNSSLAEQFIENYLAALNNEESFAYSSLITVTGIKPGGAL